MYTPLKGEAQYENRVFKTLTLVITVKVKVIRQFHILLVCRLVLRLCTIIIWVRLQAQNIQNDIPEPDII